MKHLALGACLVIWIAACGGGGKPQLLDSGVDALLACNPVAQTGCKTGEKCTWIVDLDAMGNTDEIGHVGCAPVGAAPIADGGQCADATAMANMGADACVAGDLCISGKCKPICDPQLVDGTAAGACPLNFACSLYSGVFVSGVNAVAGVCEPTCDPLTQKLNGDGTLTAACGSADPTKPSATCVVSGRFRSFHCAPFDPNDPIWAGKTDRQPPLADSHGNFFGNGCAPGFIPGYVENLTTGAMKTLCSGMCAPLKVDKAIAVGAHAADNQGDVNALAKLETEAAALAGNAVCVMGKKGSIVNAQRGEDCRFLWFPLAKGDPTMALPTPFNDTLGLCFPYEKFLSVTMPGMTQKFPEKSCAELEVTAPMTDPYGSAKENGCYPLSESRLLARKGRSAFATFRFASEPGPAVRHVFD